MKIREYIGEHNIQKQEEELFMKNELMLFNNEKFGEMRGLIIKGKPYVVASDVVKALGYKKPNNVINSKCKYTLKWGTPHPQNINKKIEMNFIPESDIYRLIFSSKLEEADKFQDWVCEEVLPTIRQSGNYDSTEQNILNIQDKKERELTLSLYKMKKVLEIDNDMMQMMLYKNKEIELAQYKQDKKLKEYNQKLVQVEKKIANMFTIGDRVSFVSEVKSVSRTTGKDYSEIYTLTYKKLKDLYGIDLKQRSENIKAKIQDERLTSGKKAYSPQTLNNKAGKLVIAEDLDLFGQLGKCLIAVKNELLK